MITTMLLPDNIHPENSVYYNGAVVLELIQQYKCIELTELYILVKQKKNMSYPILILLLDIELFLSKPFIDQLIYYDLNKDEYLFLENPFYLQQ